MFTAYSAAIIISPSIYMPSLPRTKEERRLKRAARREKQRQANISRAREMHLARRDREENKDSLPTIARDTKPASFSSAAQVGSTGIGAAVSILRTCRQTVGSRTMLDASRPWN
jgi:hypothetical protein